MLWNFISDDQIAVKVNIGSGNDLVSNRWQTKIKPIGTQFIGAYLSHQASMH